MINKINRYAMFIPAAYFCITPKVVKASEISSLPRSELKEKLMKRDNEDALAVKHQQLNNVMKWWHDPKHADVIKGFLDREVIIRELDYIRVVYGRPPVNADRRILIRRIISSLIEKEKLSDTEYDFLVSVLAYYGCV